MTFLDDHSERPKPTEDQEAAGRVLRLVTADSRLGEWPHWNCPRCGVDMSHPKTVPTFDFDRHCYDCQGLIKAQPRLGGRRAELASRGVPEKFLEPFIEPAEWPADRRRQGIALSSWTGSPWCVVLAGTVGGGKTMLATEIFWRVLQARPGLSARWWRAATAVRTIFGGFGEDESKACLAQLYRSDLLLLDEIGRGHDGRAWSLIVEIVSHRDENQLPTIMTTNRRLKTATGKAGVTDREKGLNEEDPALYRRLECGLIAGLTEPWRRA